MTGFLRFTVFALVIISAPCWTRAAALTLAHGYRVDLPKALSATRTTVIDFDIITIKRDSQVVLTIYLGNHPSFPKTPKNNPTTEVLIGSIPLKECKVHDASGVTRHLLLQMNTETWPVFAHFFYSLNLSSADLVHVRNLVDSLSSSRPNNVEPMGKAGRQ